MKKVKIIAFIVAAVLAVLLYVFLSTLGTEPEVVATKSVVTAIADIPKDTVITIDMVKVTEIPVSAVLGGAYTDTAAVIGKIAGTDIYANEQIITAKLMTVGEDDGETLAYVITPGMRAITVSVGEVSGVAFMIAPGDHVDLIGQYLIAEPSDNTADTVTTDTAADQTAEATKSYTVMLFENVKVLAVDNIYKGQGKVNTGAPAYTTLTLEVTPEQAMELSMAVYEGEIRAILRSKVDTDIADLPNITLDDILTK